MEWNNNFQLCAVIMITFVTTGFYMQKKKN